MRLPTVALLCANGKAEGGLDLRGGVMDVWGHFVPACRVAYSPQMVPSNAQEALHYWRDPATSIVTQKGLFRRWRDGRGDTSHEEPGVPSHDPDSDLAVDEQVLDGLRLSTMAKGIDLHPETYQTICRGQDPMRNQPSGVAGWTYESPQTEAVPDVRPVDRVA